jgi:hypothetical protein
MSLADRLIRWLPRLLMVAAMGVPLFAAAQQGIPMVNVKTTSVVRSTA